MELPDSSQTAQGASPCSSTFLRIYCFQILPNHKNNLEHLLKIQIPGPHFRPTDESLYIFLNCPSESQNQTSSGIGLVHLGSILLLIYTLSHKPLFSVVCCFTLTILHQRSLCLRSHALDFSKNTQHLGVYNFLIL